MTHDRRSVLSALGVVLPLGLPPRTVFAAPAGVPPVLQFRSFEESLRAALATASVANPVRVEVGHSDLLAAGVQGCHNARPFAGFSAGRLRIVRVGCEPGPAWHGVRLYVCTLDVAAADSGGEPSRPLDFALISPAPVFHTSGGGSEFAKILR